MRTTSFVILSFGAALASLRGQADTVHHSPGAMRVAIVDVNGVPLHGVELELPMLAVKFAVPDGGTLLVNHVPAGTYVLQVRRLGYAMQTRLITVHADTPTVRFALDKTVATLDTVTVLAPESAPSRDFERRLRAGHGKLFTSNDIEKSHAILLTQFLETVHGLKLQAVSGGYSERAPLGASGMCPSGVLVYLDGVAVNALEDSDPARAFRARVAVPNPNRASAALPPFDINTITLSRVAAMEVYPEGAPTQSSYGGGSRCGLVLLWSKPR